MLLRLLTRVLGAVALLAVSAAGTSWAGAGEACACSCMPMTPEETVEHADAILVGRAVSERVKGQDRIYVFEVDASYKTRVHRRIEVWTATQSPACGIELDIGATRTLAVNQATSPDGQFPQGVWSTSMCSSLAKLTPMPAAAGERLDPIAGSAVTNDNAGQSLARSPWVVAGWALAGVVVVVGGALAVRRYRRTGS